MVERQEEIEKRAKVVAVEQEAKKEFVPFELDQARIKVAQMTPLPLVSDEVRASFPKVTGFPACPAPSGETKELTIKITYSESQKEWLGMIFKQDGISIQKV